MSGNDKDTGVDLDGLLSVLGEHLYSTPRVALRELVQNAHDSIERRRIEAGDAPGAHIAVTIDVETQELVITDTGAGLTEQEIHAYLATVGAGYTRVLRSSNDTGDLIGRFGLGFLSAFVIADTVQVITTSYQTPESTWRYVSKGGHRYSVSAEPRHDGHNRPIGTQVRLTMKEQHQVFLDENIIAIALRRFCRFLAVPITVGRETINLTPPWRDPTLAKADTEERRTAEHRFVSEFDQSFEPICVLPVVRSGLSDAEGLLWVHDSGTYGTSDNREVSVFVRGMFICDDAKDLLPRWAGFVSGVIESDALMPTASREDIQRNSVYDAVQASLAETVVTGLATLAKERPELWRRVLRRHGQALVGAALVDDRLFQLVAPEIRMPTSQGDLRIDDLVVENKVHVALGAANGFETMLFRTLQIPVAQGERYGVLSFLRRWCPDRNVDLIEIGTEEGNQALFVPTTLPETDVQWLTKMLADAGEEVVPSRFSPREVPLVRVIDRDAELRKRMNDDDADGRIGAMALSLARMYTETLADRPPARLYVNMDCPAVAALVAANAMENPNALEGAMALRALKVVIAGDGSGDMRASLSVIGSVIERLLEAK